MTKILILTLALISTSTSWADIDSATSEVDRNFQQEAEARLVTSPKTPLITVEDDQTIDITGTIRHFSYESGFYGIEGDDGNQYKPTELSEGFKVEGLHVRVKAKLVKGTFLFKPWGTPIEILEIKRI